MGRISSRWPLVLLVPALIAGTGCVTGDDIDGLHRQMNDIEKEIAALEKKSSSKEEVARLNETVAQQANQLLKSNADTGVKLDELSREIGQLQAKLEDTNRRLAELSQQIAATQGDLFRLRGGTTPPESPAVGQPQPNPAAPAPDSTVVVPRGASATPQQLYDTAYGDYTRGRYELAVQGFTEYLSQYPSTDLSDNAQYWIGECYFSQQKYREAIADFDELLKKWPQSDKAPAALLKKGYALAELGDRAAAVVQLQYVLHEYPLSDEARLARQKLKSLGVDTR
jgi:tol-pal system protein YbgF